MSAIFTKNILQTKYMFLYDLTRKKQSYSYEIEVVLIGFALQTQKDTNLQTTSVYRTYFEWILMKYTVETKDILSHMVVNACTCRVTYGTPLR